MATLTADLFSLNPIWYSSCLTPPLRGFGSWSWIAGVFSGPSLGAFEELNDVDGDLSLKLFPVISPLFVQGSLCPVSEIGNRVSHKTRVHRFDYLGVYEARAVLACPADAFARMFGYVVQVRRVRVVDCHCRSELLLGGSQAIERGSAYGVVVTPHGIFRSLLDVFCQNRIGTTCVGEFPRTITDELHKKRVAPRCLCCCLRVIDADLLSASGNGLHVGVAHIGCGNGAESLERGAPQEREHFVVHQVGQRGWAALRKRMPHHAACRRALQSCPRRE